MRIKNTYKWALISFFLTATIIKVPTTEGAVNPFLTPSNLPLQAPPFDKINNSDYQPAFEIGMQEQKNEILAIANNEDKPSFENTIVALEKSGTILTRVSNTFFAVVQANSNPTLDEIQIKISPKLAAHRDAIFLNQQLFFRVKHLYDQRNELNLDQQASQTLSIYYRQFINAGAHLNEVNKEKLRHINEQIAALEVVFQKQLIASTNANKLIVTEKNQLAGLSEDELNTFLDSTGNYVIPLKNTTLQPLLSSLTDRNTREKLFELSWNRAERDDEYDTRDTVSSIAKLRAKKAELLGYSNYAAYILNTRMADSSEKVNQFLDQLILVVTSKINADASLLQSIIDNEQDKIELKPWDWAFYANKVRQAKYDLDENEIKPYFELNHVLIDGAFYAAHRLYGIRFEERYDLPVYHPDVRIFNIYDNNDLLLGLLYIDYFKRNNKLGGAWMSHFIEPSKLLGAHPVMYVVTNFTKPANGQPTLLSLDNTRQLFHEIGHALHELFTEATYPAISTNMAPDFAEFPSQFNEHWALDTDVLKHYAIHYQTGESIPDSFINKIKKAQTFNQAFAVGEMLASSKLDLDWHRLPAEAKKQEVDLFEAQSLAQSGTNFPNVPPNYRSSYFSHIWGGGYAAGYYSYFWSEMLDDDIYEWFMEHGGLTRQNGERFRKLILSQGASKDYEEMFVSFYGGPPSIEPMLRHRGLIE